MDPGPTFPGTTECNGACYNAIGPHALITPSTPHHAAGSGSRCPKTNAAPRTRYLFLQRVLVLRILPQNRPPRTSTLNALSPSICTNTQLENAEAQYQYIHLETILPVDLEDSNLERNRVLTNALERQVNDIIRQIPQEAPPAI